MKPVITPAEYNLLSDKEKELYVGIEYEGGEIEYILASEIKSVEKLSDLN